MIVNIYYYPVLNQTPDAAFCQFVGTIEMDNFDEEQCFLICNWHDVGIEKPENLHADIASVGSGICFENTETKQYHFAKGIGWIRGCKEVIDNYVKSCAKNHIYM